MSDQTPMTERRFGRFRVSSSLLKTQRGWDDLMGVFAGLLVTRAEYLADADCIEYTAASMHFEPVPIAMICPEYVAEITRCSFGVSLVKWVKLDGGAFFDQVGMRA